MLEKFLDIVFQKLSVEDVKLTDKFMDLGCDDFDYVEIIMQLETEFNIDLQPSDVSYHNGYNLKTVYELYLVCLVKTFPFCDEYSTKEMIDRLEEFEVIKDYEVDLISLNSLFDFYGYEFSI